MARARGRRRDASLGKGHGKGSGTSFDTETARYAAALQLGSHDDSSGRKKGGAPRGRSPLDAKNRSGAGPRGRAPDDNKSGKGMDTRLRRARNDGPSPGATGAVRPGDFGGPKLSRAADVGAPARVFRGHAGKGGASWDIARTYPAKGGGAWCFSMKREIWQVIGGPSRPPPQEGQAAGQSNGAARKSKPGNADSSSSVTALFQAASLKQQLEFFINQFQHDPLCQTAVEAKRAQLADINTQEEEAARIVMPADQRFKRCHDRINSAKMKVKQHELDLDQAAAALRCAMTTFREAEEVLDTSQGELNDLEDELKDIKAELGSAPTSVKQALTALQALPIDEWRKPETAASVCVLANQMLAFMSSNLEAFSSTVPGFNDMVTAKVLHHVGPIPPPPADGALGPVLGPLPPPPAAPVFIQLTPTAPVRLPQSEQAVDTGAGIYGWEEDNDDSQEEGDADDEVSDLVEQPDIGTVAAEAAQVLAKRQEIAESTARDSTGDDLSVVPVPDWTLVKGRHSKHTIYAPEVEALGNMAAAGDSKHDREDASPGSGERPRKALVTGPVNARIPLPAGRRKTRKGR